MRPSDATNSGGEGLTSTGFSDLKVFSGSAHQTLTKEIAEFLGIQVGQARLRRFPDSEVSFQIDENIRGADVFIIQPTCAPVDSHIMELLVMIDAFKRSSAARITAVIPYYGYARQDRKDKPRVPISAKLVANLLSAAGTNRVLDGFAQGADPGVSTFRSITCLPRRSSSSTLGRIESPRLTIVSPDAGGAERAWACQASQRRTGGDRQAAHRRRHDRGDERDRRRRGAHVHPAGRHHRYRRHDTESGERAERGGG